VSAGSYGGGGGI